VSESAPATSGSRASPGFKPVMLDDLKVVRRRAAALLVLAKNATDAELENLGILRSEVDEVREAADAAERVIPSARNTVLATFSGDLTKELILSAYTRSQKAIHALGPLVVLRLAEKIDDDQAPGSTRVLLELAKGLGLFVPAEPMAAPQRVSLLSLDELRKQPLSSLKDAVLRDSA
jgi:hypothetical protein